MKLISWNVNGIRAVMGKGLMNFIQQESPDILCLQETKAHPEQVPEDARKLGFTHTQWSSAQRKGYSGVATFSKQTPLSVKTGIDIQEYEKEGRLVVTEYPQFLLYNIYFPNGGSGDVRHQFKQKFLSDLSAHLRQKLQEPKPIIVVGDYNVAHREMDVYDPVRLACESGFLPEERQWMSDFLKLGFIDTFRYFHKDEQHRFSWWSYKEFARSGNRGWRIDYICASESLKPHLKAATILDAVTGSDHCPVSLTLSF